MNSNLLRLTIVGVGIMAVLALGAGILVAGTVSSAGGMLTVRVHETGPDGVDLYIPVPANLVEATIAVVPVVARLGGSSDLDRELARVRGEIEPWLPAIEGVLDELDAMGDVTLVRVDGPREQVVVEKRGGSLDILVEEPGTRVSVVVPWRVVESLRGLLRAF